MVGRGGILRTLHSGSATIFPLQRFHLLALACLCVGALLCLAFSIPRGGKRLDVDGIHGDDLQNPHVIDNDLFIVAVEAFGLRLSLFDRPGSERYQSSTAIHGIDAHLRDEQCVLRHASLPFLIGCSPFIKAPQSEVRSTARRPHWSTPTTRAESCASTPGPCSPGAA